MNNSLGVYIPEIHPPEVVPAVPDIPSSAEEFYALTSLQKHGETEFSILQPTDENRYVGLAIPVEIALQVEGIQVARDFIRSVGPLPGPHCDAGSPQALDSPPWRTHGLPMALAA